MWITIEVSLLKFAFSELFCAFSLEVVDVEFYFLWLRLDLAYAVMAGLYYINESEVESQLALVRAAIVNNVYPKIMGFGPEHEINIDSFIKEHATYLSLEIGKQFFGGRLVLGSADGGYEDAESFGGIEGNKSMFNAQRNKRKTLNKVH